MNLLCMISGSLLLCGMTTLGRAQAVGAEVLSRLDQLPAFRSSFVKIGTVSTYDRSGGNDDGFSGKYSFVRKEPEGLVLADLKGPGAIYRIWTPTPTDDTLEFLFDGETQPRLSIGFRELFLGTHPAFPRPLVGNGVGGYYSYVPMPFATSCVIRLRAPKAQFYQINYALFASDQRIESFRPDLTREQQTALQESCALWNSAGKDVSTFANRSPAQVRTVRTAVQLQSGASSKVFEGNAGGRIVGLRVGPAAAVAGKARDLMLRISFDGEEAAVLCPLGDFFGYAWGEPAMRSLLIGTSDETNYCYFPMPFARNASVEIVSERASPIQLTTEVLHTAEPRRHDEGIFHAVWRRQNPTVAGEPYEFLRTEGRGHLVGVVLQAQGFESGKTLFFEGDDQTTIDGEVAIQGTGSEDFFNGGWYDVPDRWDKRMSFPLSGCLGYAKHLGRTGGYRFFLGDVYAFQKSLRQTIEHAGERNSIPTDYCSVTYFYTEAAPVPQNRLPELEDRRVVDLAEVVFPAWWQLPLAAWSFDRASLARKVTKIGNEDVRYLSFNAIGQDWFGPHFLEPICDVPAAGEYAISIEALKGPSQGKVQLFRDENPVAQPADLYAAQLEKSGRLELGRMPLRQGQNTLMLKVVGRNENSSGLGLDLIQLICVRQP